MTPRDLYNLELAKHAPRSAPRGEGRQFRSLAARGLIHRSTLDYRWRITPSGVKALAEANEGVLS